MPKRFPRFRSTLNKLRETLFKGLFRARYRYDIFISYNHSAKPYAKRLKDQLVELDFACFFDEEESPPGVSLDPTLEKALRKSAVLVLLATERALTRPYIALEFEKFVSTGRRIIPINVSEALTKDDERALANPPWDVIKSRKIVWLDETAEAFESNKPSLSIADGIDKSFKYTRRNARVRMEIIGTAAVALLILISGSLVLVRAFDQVKVRTAQAEAARRNADEQQAKANSARQAADTQLKNAEQAKKTAIEESAKAGKARKDALAATAEADKQQDLARRAKLEAEQQLERVRHLQYVSDMATAQKAYEAGDMTLVGELLKSNAPDSGEKDDLRTFYWFYRFHNSFRELPWLPQGQGLLAFSPDRKTVATASSSQEVNVLDITNWNRPTRKFPAFQFSNPVSSVSFSPNGQILGVSEKDAIKLWDISRAEPQPLKDLKQLSYVSCFAFSPDDRLIASGSDDGIVKVWDAQTQKEIARLQGHAFASRPGPDEGVVSIAFSPDSKTLVSAGGDKKVIVWNVTDPINPSLATVLLNHSGAVRSVAFSRDGETLATASDDQTVRLWQVKNWKEMQQIPTFASLGSCCLTFLPNRRTLAWAADGMVRFWDYRNGRDMVSLTGQYTFNRIMFSADGQLLASESEGSGQKLWDVGMLGDIDQLEGHQGDVTSLAFSADGSLLASASKDKTVKLWKIGSTDEPQTFKGALDEANSVAFSADAKLLAWAPGDNSVIVRDLETEHNTRFSGSMDADQVVPIKSIAFSKVTGLLASGDSVGNICIWKVGAWDKPDCVTDPEAKPDNSTEITSVAFSPDGQTLAAATIENTILLWDVSAPQLSIKLITSFEHSKTSMRADNTIHAVAFSPKGKMLVSAGGDHIIDVWDVSVLSKPRLITLLKGHSTKVLSVSFSPDGKTLASGGLDQLKLWDVSSWQQMATTTENLEVSSIAFSPDGHMLAMSKGRVVKLWIAAKKEDVVAEARK